MFTFNHISLQLGGNTILNDMSGKIAKGAVTALIGPNGSGKSSLLSVLAGLVKPSAGDVSFAQQPLSSISRAQLAKQLALLPQRNPVPATLNVADLVCFGRHPHRPWYKNISNDDKQIIDWAMQETGVKQYASQLLTDLSGGELQRTWLAMVLAQDTEVLMLDEPTSWLDISHQLGLLKIVQRLNQQYNKTIVWVLHDLNQAAQFSDQAMLINHGQIVSSGDARSVINAKDVSEVYQTPVTCHQIGSQQVLWPEQQQ
ncbi:MULTISPECIES: ABC transporter ATP-binding protein [unclassified Agarivorans]|uniref:ABC transporter ATP-binding protein n=1 Tax=unclassified Agarivorans TaxID=2636026 RepID=UPI0026E255F0|nr:MULTISPECIES: ABC transporter ATP-binding protein [unclassified Agarivorans]MDO6686353.1 ABC transporter ATP-binding protein [Agarivorans sp. 3_MG-2023]MDO6713655.1 ABC transporter ATP-binding protein [Agarivorans sp. 2_MG-2023]